MRLRHRTLIRRVRLGGLPLNLREGAKPLGILVGIQLHGRVFLDECHGAGRSHECGHRHGRNGLPRGIRLRQRGRAFLRRVRLRVVGSGEHDGVRLGRFPAGLDPGSLEEFREIQREAVRDERAHGVQERGRSGRALAIRGDREVRQFAQGVLHEAREDRARAHFDEGANAIGVHGLDLFREPDRGSDLRGQGRADAILSAGVTLRGGIGVDGLPGNRDGLALEERGERIDRTSDDARMERGGHGEARALESLRLQLRGGRVHGLGRAGDDDLLLRIAVRDHHRRLEGRFEGFDGLLAQ